MCDSALISMCNSELGDHSFIVQLPPCVKTSMVFVEMSKDPVHLGEVAFVMTLVGCMTEKIAIGSLTNRLCAKQVWEQADGGRR